MSNSPNRLEQNATPPPPGRLVILMPVFNDWESLQALLGRLDKVAADHGIDADVLVVDDGSTEPASLPDRFRALGDVRILELRRNLGHQRAIAVGLAYVHENLACRAVLVMDADGEDDPGDVPRLLDRFEAGGGRAIVFAGRARRTEGLLFRALYQAFKAAHLLLTGYRVRVGNFSVVPAAALSRLVVVSELWNHFAASVYKARLPADVVPVCRGRRLAGRSRMNFVSLVVHGLSAISVFGEVVGVRLLVVLAVLMVLTALAACATVGIRLFTDWAIPGWATYATGLLVVVLLQMVVIASVFMVLVLGGRAGSSFLPIRDYHYFCGRVRTVGGARPVGAGEPVAEPLR